MKRRTARWALAGAAAAMLAIAPPVARAGLWSAPATLGQASTAVEGDLAVDADGTAIVAWADSDGAVRAAVRAPGAAFAPTLTLAPDGRGAVAVAHDGHGGWLVAWSRNGSLGLAERTPARPELTVVPTGIGGVQLSLDVAFAGTGRAIVVWSGTDGAIHALSRELGGQSVPLPDLAAGPGNSGPRLGAAGGHAVAAWTNREGGPPTTTRIRAALLTQAGSFTAPEDVASATSHGAPTFSGSDIFARKVVVSAGGAADVLISSVEFLGVPGELAVAALVAARPRDPWLPAERFGYAGVVPSGEELDADIAAGQAGDALYVQGERKLNSSMVFTARGRTAGAASYGEASVLHAGARGQVRAAPLAGGRYLVLLRSGTSLFSRAGNTATGFENPLVFSGTDGSRILGLAGAPSGLAAAAWLTTSGQLHAAIYDDSLQPRSPPPPAAADTVAPRLSRLSVAPRRFPAPRRAHGAEARGTRIRWTLSERARVTFRVDRTRSGVKRGRRLARQGTFARMAPKGRTTLRFTGFLRGRALRPGHYVLTAIARDAVGNLSSTKRTGFTVVRR